MGKMLEYTVRDMDGEFNVAAATLKSARRKAAEQIIDAWQGQRTCTVYVHVRVISRTGEYIDAAVEVPPQEPRCTTARRRHRWESLSVTGSASGGGVVVRHRCADCGVLDTEDTSATDPVDGKPRPHRRFSAA